MPRRVWNRRGVADRVCGESEDAGVSCELSMLDAVAQSRLIM